MKIQQAVLTQKRIDGVHIAGNMFLWIMVLIAPGSMIHITAFPDRAIIGYSLRFLALAVLLLAGLLFHLWRFGWCPTLPAEGRLKAMASRLGWISGFLLVTLSMSFLAPYTSSVMLFWGVPAIITWAAVTGLHTPSPPATKPVRSIIVTCLLILLLSTVFYTIIGAYFTRVAGEHSGDEGHYLIQARSLYEDQDLNIRNQFENPDNTPVHGSPHSRGDAWYPRHAAGLALLLAPTVPYGFAVRHFVLALIASMALIPIVLLALKMGASLRYAWIVTLLFGGGIFWGIYSSRALPEVLGAGLTTWGLLMCFWQIRRPWMATIISLCIIGFLPWAHTRFIPIAGLLFGCFGLHGLLFARPVKPMIIRMIIYSFLFVALLAFYQYIQWRMYEGGQAYAADSLLFSLPMGLWHTLASSRGILYVFPMFTCAIAAACWATTYPSARIPALYVLLLFSSVFFTSSATMWWTGGATVPGRFLLVVLPAMMACLATAMTYTGHGFRALTIYAGVTMIGAFPAFLAVLPHIGRFFADPFLLTRHHGLLRKLPSLYYDAQDGWAAGPAIFLYLGAMALVFIPKRFDIRCSRVILPGMALIVAVYAQLHRSDTHASPEYTAKSLQQIANMRKGWQIVLGDRTQPVSILDYSDLLHWTSQRQLNSITTADLGTTVANRIISVPNLTPNDWDGRPYRWATLIPPMKPGKGRFVLHYQGTVHEGSGVAFVIREGSHTLAERHFPANSEVDEILTFDLRSAGDLYILARITGDQGAMTSHRIRGSLLPPQLIEKANLAPLSYALQPLQTESLESAADTEHL